MEFQLPISIRELPGPIKYGDRIMLIGSCFTEHIGNALMEWKFEGLQNPHGILFGPDSVCRSLQDCLDDRQYEERDLFYLNECWNSWHHHSRFSATDRAIALQKINAGIGQAHQFLLKADWLIITLGSSFSYKLTDSADLGSCRAGQAVANCHRAPQSWFSKELLPTHSIIAELESVLVAIQKVNPSIRFIFTISPVRHIRDGVVENNRSKARLISAVQELVEHRADRYYFPAYELVVDVLRDYRFYDIDLVHPNYPATDFVMEKFIGACIDASTALLMKEVKKLVTARKHRPFQAETEAHRNFLLSNLEKARQLQADHPMLDLSKEIAYFSQTAR